MLSIKVISFTPLLHKVVRKKYVFFSCHVRGFFNYTKNYQILKPFMLNLLDEKSLTAIRNSQPF